MNIPEMLKTIHWTTVIDLSIVFALIYAALYLIRGTRSLTLVKLILAIFSVYALSHFFELKTLSWVVERFSLVVVLIVVIIFQAEIRRSVEGAIRWRLFDSDQSHSIRNPTLIKNILQAVETMSKEKIGAIIAFENSTKLDEYIESGIVIQGNLSTELLVTLFSKTAPTHDGAVVIRNGCIEAAGCFLPLTDSKTLDRRLGTRHMAAIGLSEISDAMMVVVSEETGTISIVEGGNITRYLNREALETRLFNLYQEVTSADPKFND